LITVALCLAGVAWILIPHPWEGRVVVVLSTHYGLGIHLYDPVGIVVPAAGIAVLWHADAIRSVLRWAQEAVARRVERRSRA
jgi:hypothetical protein